MVICLERGADLHMAQLMPLGSPGKIAVKWVCVYYYTRLMACFPGQPGYAGTRKVKPVWIQMS